MSQKEKTDPLEHHEVNESPNGNLTRLVGLTRQAYEQKRTKDCLDLTRAILLIDPDNADAKWMRSSIQSEMHRDLENARTFLRQAHSKESSETQSQPGHEDLEPPVAETIPFPTAIAPAPAAPLPRTRWLTRAIAVVVLLVLGLIVGGLPRYRTKLNPVGPSLLTLNASGSSKPIATGNAAQPDVLPLIESEEPFLPSSPAPVLPVPLPDAEQRLAADRPSALVAPASGLGAKLSPRPTAEVGGTLAVSSPTSVDIYKNDVYLGSAPVSLDLPSGSQTLEYRHGNLRRTLTHIIGTNETTRAMITFEVTVQINSKPWSEVFLDGVDRKDLGQTPLSGLRVPIGSVLIFENPQFQSKKYRVTGNETGIQIVFP